MALLNSCHIYRNYRRPEGLPVDSLFRETNNSRTEDTLTLGDLPWQEMFQDTLLRELIRYGLENNTDIQTALLRVDQAKAQLKAARLSFLPSLTLSPQGTLTRTDGNKAVKTYELPVQASWEIDLFGSLRNAKKRNSDNPITARSLSASCPFRTDSDNSKRLLLAPDAGRTVGNKSGHTGDMEGTNTDYGVEV